MPSEPEKRIEPLLKAYAEKRRQAGASQPGLHPAARRLLQAEVRQRWPTRGGSASPRWYQKIITFWPRLVAAGAIAVVLGMALWFLGPANKPDSTHVAKQDSLSRLPAKPADEIVLTTGGSRNEPAADAEFDRLKLADVKKLTDSSGMPEQKVSLESVSQRGVADQPAPAAAPTLAVPAQMKAKEAVPPATAPAEPSLAARPVAPLTEAPTAGGVPLPASRANERLAENIQRDGRVLTEEARATRGRYVALAPTSTLETANRPLRVLSFSESAPARQYYFRNLSATPSPSVPGAPQAAGIAGAGAEPQSLRVDRSPAGPARQAQAGQAPGVLVNFAIEQRGPSLRIIDDDGSVYEGRVLANAEPAVEAKFRQPVALKREASAPSPTPTPALSKSISETRVAEVYADKNSVGKDADGFADAARPQLAFEVFGTNKTLRQSISLAGTLYFSSTNIQVTTNTARFQRGFGAVTLNDGFIATQNGKEQANTNISQVLRILGRGRVNGSNELSVDAVPAQR